MPTVDQRELAKKEVRQQQNRCDLMNYLYDRSGRHDLQKGTHPHAVFTGLAEEYALEIGRDLLREIADTWHLQSVRDGVEIKDHAKRLLKELKDEAQN